MRVLIADDHPMVRDALARTVRTLESDAEIVEFHRPNRRRRASLEAQQRGRVDPGPCPHLLYELRVMCAYRAKVLKVPCLAGKFCLDELVLS